MKKKRFRPGWFRPGWCSCGHPASSHSSTPPNPCQVCGCTEFSY